MAEKINLGVLTVALVPRTLVVFVFFGYPKAVKLCTTVFARLAGAELYWPDCFSRGAIRVCSKRDFAIFRFF